MAIEQQENLTRRLSREKPDSMTPREVADKAVERAVEQIRRSLAMAPVPLLADAIAAAVKIELGKRLADELGFEFKQLVDRALLKVERC